jgi:hypothetical protein
MLPMSLLAVARLDSLRGLNPLFLVPRIVRVAEHYAYSCLAFYAVPLVIAVLCTYAFAPTIKAYWALESVSALPEFGLGSYALFFIACLVVVYGVFVAGRVLGALGAADADRLNWE